MSASPLIFIAYFGPDKPRAVALHGALAARGLRPWCDAVDLLPGDLWDEVIPARLRAAGVILVLVSKTEHDGWYAKEEIADGIASARRDPRKRVVPVLLKGATSEDAPYGLKRVAGIDVAGDDYGPVVDGVVRMLQATGAKVPTANDPPPPSHPQPSLSRAPRVDHQAIVDAVIRRRLDRDLLLSWLPDSVRARLPRQRSDFEQMTSDVGELIRIGRLDDGQWAIAVWLRQAERLAGPFAEARVFRDALAKLP